MDLMYFLRARAKFVRYIYESAVPLFEEIKRKIEAGEEPYVDRRYSEEADEPAFLEEWEYADLAGDVIGATCLSMLQAAFHSFLREYVKEVGGEKLLGQLGEMKQGNWFANYRTLFANILSVDWAVSGVDLPFLEQMVLTRNDFQHNTEIFSNYIYQTKDHAKKYPDTAFRDPHWPVSVFMPARLIVEQGKLEVAIQGVEQLCEYLDGARRP